MKNASNSRLWYLIKRDGSISSKQTLYLEDKREREELIMDHFRKAYRDRYNIDIPTKLISRDKPEDFVFQGDSGELYPYEIISISDSDLGYKKISNQVLIEKLVTARDIKNTILAYVPVSSTKIQITQQFGKIDQFPSIELQDTNHTKDLLKKVRESGLPVFRTTTDAGGKIIINYDGSSGSLLDIVNNAINEKVNKKYRQISQMTLLIDDQTTKHIRSDFEKVSPRLVKLHKNSPFKEIFIYSGMYLDNSGLSRAQAEFILYPIKCKYDEYTQRV